MPEIAFILYELDRVSVVGCLVWQMLRCSSKSVKRNGLFISGPFNSVQ